MKVNKLLKSSTIAFASLGLVSLSLTSCSKTNTNTDDADGSINIVVTTPIKQDETLEFDLGAQFLVAFGGFDFPVVEYVSDFLKYSSDQEFVKNTFNISFFGTADNSYSMEEVPEISNVDIVVGIDAAIGEKVLNGYYINKDNLIALFKALNAGTDELPPDDVDALIAFYSTFSVTNYITPINITLTIIAA
jgi:hypothetical protein